MEQEKQVQAYLHTLAVWDEAPVAFGVARPLGADDFAWVYGNNALWQCLGQKNKAMQNDTFRKMFAKGSEDWPALVEATVRTGKPCRVTQHSAQLQKTLCCKTYCPVPGLCAFFVRDVSDRVRLAQKNEAAQKRLELILQNTTDTVFDFDLITRTLYSSPDAVKRYGAQAVIPNAPETMQKKGLMNAEGAQAFAAAVRAIEGGAQEQTFDLQLRFHPDMTMMWYQMKLLCYADVLTHETSVIGYVRNIDRQRRQTERLREAAERDGLTGLYNRSAADRRVIPALREAQAFAFFVFDVDDFKSMNDSRGHAYGDTMLLCFAQALRGCFRRDEVIWRHGGDEFCACIFGKLSRRVLEQRCEEVLRCFARVGREISPHDVCPRLPQAGGMEDVCTAPENAAQPMPAPVPHRDTREPVGPVGMCARASVACVAQDAAYHAPAHSKFAAHPDITCSIGVAYGKGPVEYCDCFSAADAALFATKQRGKNGYTLVEMA